MQTNAKQCKRIQSNANNIKTKAGNTDPWPLAILHSSELSEKEPDSRKALKHMTLKKNRLENSLLSPWHSPRINISLSAIRGHTRQIQGFFDDSERDSRKIQTLTACTFSRFGAVGEGKPWLFDRERAEIMLYEPWQPERVTISLSAYRGHTRQIQGFFDDSKRDSGRFRPWPPARSHGSELSEKSNGMRSDLESRRRWKTNGANTTTKAERKQGNSRLTSWNNAVSGLDSSKG